MDIKEGIDLVSTTSNTAKTVAETLRILVPENPAKKNEYILDEDIKKRILSDAAIPLDDRLALCYGYAKVKKRFKRRKDILDLAEKYFGQSKERFTNKLEALDDDWLDFFLDKAENTSNDKIKKVWAQMLSEQLNYVDSDNKQNISKKLISTLCLLEAEDISAFHSICCMAFDSVDRESSRYPFVYVKENSKFLAKIGVRRYNLASLAHLGLLEYNGPGSSFVLPRKTPILKYHNMIIEFTDSERINNGNVRLTSDGRTLLGITKSDFIDGYIETCKKIWDERGYKYKVEEI